MLILDEHVRVRSLNEACTNLDVLKLVQKFIGLRPSIMSLLGLAILLFLFEEDSVLALLNRHASAQYVILARFWAHIEDLDLVQLDIAPLIILSSQIFHV